MCEPCSAFANMNQHQPDGIVIRPANETDSATIAANHAASWRDVYAHPALKAMSSAHTSCEAARRISHGAKNLIRMPYVDMQGSWTRTLALGKCERAMCARDGMRPILALASSGKSRTAKQSQTKSRKE